MGAVSPLFPFLLITNEGTHEVGLVLWYEVLVFIKNSSLGEIMVVSPACLRNSNWFSSNQRSSGLAASNYTCSLVPATKCIKINKRCVAQGTCPHDSNFYKVVLQPAPS